MDPAEENPDEIDSIELLARWRQGDEAAATRMFDRYANRLIGLAHARLSDQMKRRVEPEDIVQSAYRSFFRKASDGRYTLESHGDLWRLLAAITVSKVRGQVEFHTAKKRRVYAEEPPPADQSYRVHPEAIVQDPSPADAAVMEEEMSRAMAGLDELQQRIFELALENLTAEEIAAKVRRSGRTVRRTLQQVREHLEQRLLRSASV